MEGFQVMGINSSTAGFLVEKYPFCPILLFFQEGHPKWNNHFPPKKRRTQRPWRVRHLLLMPQSLSPAKLEDATAFKKTKKMGRFCLSHVSRDLQEVCLIFLWNTNMLTYPNLGLMVDSMDLPCLGKACSPIGIGNCLPEIKSFKMSQGIKCSSLQSKRVSWRRFSNRVNSENQNVIL